jgi:hypothetical protein
MKPVVLYRNGEDWKQEEESVRKFFPCIDSRMNVKSGDLIIPRFSALPFFRELEKDVEFIGGKLINSYDQHRYIADLGNWYQDLYEVTPRTWDNIPDLPDNCSFILKGETNSKKFYWRSSMFANNKREAVEVQGKLQQDSMLQYQKIYIREYIPLEKLCDGLQGLPISREYRFFVYKKTILSGGFYWSSHIEEILERGIKIDPAEVPITFLYSVIDKIQSTELVNPPVYYVIDVAKTYDGKWIVIELNDGTMSGLSENNPDVLYSALHREILIDEG